MLLHYQDNLEIRRSTCVCLEARFGPGIGESDNEYAEMLDINEMGIMAMKSWVLSKQTTIEAVRLKVQQLTMEPHVKLNTMLPLHSQS